MLIVQPEAEADLAEAHAWYEALRSGLGDEFISEVDRVFAAIELRPVGFAIVHRNTRKASLRRFPYIVLYTLQGTTDIVILGVLHQRREPRLMRRRTI